MKPAWFSYFPLKITCNVIILTSNKKEISYFQMFLQFCIDIRRHLIRYKNSKIAQHDAELARKLLKKIRISIQDKDILKRLLDHGY